MLYMLMNKETAECAIYNNKESAEKNMKANYLICPIDLVDKDAEIVVYSNINKSNNLDLVAEFINKDLLIDDLEYANENNPIRVLKE